MKIIFTAIILSISVLPLKAQTNNSPYSVLGIGDIEDSHFDRTTGLGNTGISYRSNRYLINSNPASYSAIDNDFFISEFAGRSSYIKYLGGTVGTNNNESFDITFRKIALGIKPAKHWGSSIGLLPYSSQNYEFNSTVTGSTASGLLGNYNYKGSGGIYKIYWGNSYEFFKHLSVGANLSYLFGSLKQQIMLQDPNHNELISTHNDVGLSNFYLDYGIQLYGKLSKKLDYSVGATFAPMTPLNVDYSQTVYNPDSSVAYSNSIPFKPFTLPNNIGAGLSVTYNKRYTFVADYKTESWGSVNNTGYVNSFLNTTDFMSYKIGNSNRFSAGLEFSKKRVVYNTLVELMYFQAGFYTSNSYLSLYGQQIKDVGGTLGIGVNAKRSLLSYAVTLQFGVKGIQNLQLVQQRYANVTITFSYRDIWLTKGRKFF